MVGPNDDAPANPFAAPEEEKTEIAKPPTPPEPEPGSDDTAGDAAPAGLPPIMEVFQATLDDLMAHFGPYLLAGLGWMVPLLAAIFLALGVVFGLACLGPVLGALVDEPELGGALGMLIAMPLYVLVLFGASVLIAPLTASLCRALLAHIEHGSDLGFGSAYQSVRVDLGQVILLMVVTMGMTLAGLLACYFPALIVSLLVGFAFPALIVHRVPAIAAVRLSVRHVMAEPAWHLGLWGLTLAIGFVGGSIPLIGAALSVPVSLAFVLRAYIGVFGGSGSPAPTVDAT